MRGPISPHTSTTRAPASLALNFLYDLNPNNGSKVDVRWPQWKEHHQILWYNKGSNSLRNDTYRKSSFNLMYENIKSLRY
ncbi:hypothetical protein HDV63DRAFT_378040 [Trichoderma sp. SZMC 28014]